MKKQFFELKHRFHFQDGCGFQNLFCFQNWRVLSLLFAALFFSMGCSSQSAEKKKKDSLGEDKASEDKSKKNNNSHKRTKSKKQDPQKTQTVQGTSAPRWRRVRIHSAGYGFGGVASRSAEAWVLAERKQVSLLSQNTGQIIKDIPLEPGTSSMALGPKGNYLALGFSKGRAQLLNLESQEFSPLPSLPDTITSMVFFGRKNLLVSASQDGTLLLTDLQSKKGIHTAKSPQNKGFYSLAAHPQKPLIAVGGYGTLYLFDLSKKVFLPNNIKGPEKALRSLSFRPDGKKLVVAGETSAMIFDTTTWNASKTFPQHVAPVAFDPTGTWLALGTKQRHLAIKKVANLKTVATLESTAPPWWLAFGPKGHLLAAAQRQDSNLHFYAFDKKPDLGFGIRNMNWYDDDGPTVYLTLKVVGDVPKKSVAYGRLSGLKAIDDQGKPLKRISSSPKYLKSMSPRNRRFPMTESHGFSLPLRLHGIPEKVKSIKKLEGDFLMKVAERSQVLTIEDPASFINKPLPSRVQKTLDNMGLKVTLRLHLKRKDSLEIIQKGTVGQLEAVEFIDENGKKQTVNSISFLGAPPSFSSNKNPKYMKGWKMQLYVNPALHLIRGHFVVKDIDLPPRKK